MLRNNEVIYYNSIDRTIDIVSVDSKAIKKIKISYQLSNSLSDIFVFPESDLFCFVETEIRTTRKQKKQDLYLSYYKYRGMSG